MTGDAAAPGVHQRDLAGIWRRTLLARPGAPDDRSTQVFWFQGRAIYADWRAPAALLAPGSIHGEAGGAPVAEATQRAQEAFAGVIETQVEPAGLICEWRREIDWSGARPAPRDVGRLSWRDGDLFEEGALEPYEEVWVRDATAGPGDIAARLKAPDGRIGVLVVIGKRFLWVRDRAPDVAERLAAQWRTGPSAADVLAFEASLGAVEPDGLVIRQSSDPMRPGALLGPWPVMAGPGDAPATLALSLLGSAEPAPWHVAALEHLG